MQRHIQHLEYRPKQSAMSHDHDRIDKTILECAKRSLSAATLTPLTSTKKSTFQFPVPGNCLKVATQPNTHKDIYAKDDKGALSSLSEADVA